MLLVLALTKVVSQYSLVGTIEDAKVIPVRPGWLKGSFFMHVEIIVTL